MKNTYMFTLKPQRKNFQMVWWLFFVTSITMPKSLKESIKQDLKSGLSVSPFQYLMRRSIKFLQGQALMNISTLAETTPSIFFMKKKEPSHLMKNTARLQAIQMIQDLLRTM